MFLLKMQALWVKEIALFQAEPGWRFKALIPLTCEASQVSMLIHPLSSVATTKNELFQQHCAILGYSLSFAIKRTERMWSFPLYLVSSSLLYWTEFSCWTSHLVTAEKKTFQYFFSLIIMFCLHNELTELKSFGASEKNCWWQFGIYHPFQLAPWWCLVQLTWNYRALKSDAALQRVQLYLQYTAG